MPSPQIERKLAAIMFTDIAGYTAQMSKNEDKALEMLRKKRSIIKPLIDNHNGTYVKEIGDGTLSYFESGYNASACAKELQKELQNDELNIKVGIHIGDIVFDEEDVYGDGVNIASRIESLAPAGGVLISKNVYDELINKDDFDGIALGLQSLKGVGRLVELYAIKDDYLVVPKLQDYKDTEIDIHKDDEVPSIAIIPFNNKGADEDVFYAYGISADLISDCSGAGLIRVASLSDIEKLDYTNFDNTELSKKLLVRYIAQGTLWKMGDMFQLSIELYDTKDKKVVWSDRWQEKWDNLPKIKGSLSDGLLKALDTTSKVEKKVETTNTKAYELYLKAKHIYANCKDTNDIEAARELLHQAIELDDNLIAAKALLGNTYLAEGLSFDDAMEIFTPTLNQAEKLGDKAGMGYVLNAIGNVHSATGKYVKAVEYYDRSLAIQEELGNKSGMATGLNNTGVVHKNKGNYEKAREYYERAMKINEELDEKLGIALNLSNIGFICWRKGNYEKALDYYDRSVKLQEGVDGDSGYSLLSIGLVYYNKGDYGKAMDHNSKQLVICEDLGDKGGIGFCYHFFGMLYYNKGDYNKAVDYLEKSISIQKILGWKEIELYTTTYLYLTYTHLGKNYDEDILTLIKDTENIEFEVNFRLYQLLDDTTYLDSAYMQVQEKSSELGEEVGKKLLSYPIPKAIVEEWEKVK